MRSIFLLIGSSLDMARWRRIAVLLQLRPNSSLRYFSATSPPAKLLRFGKRLTHCPKRQHAVPAAQTPDSICRYDLCGTHFHMALVRGAQPNLQSKRVLWWFTTFA